MNISVLPECGAHCSRVLLSIVQERHWLHVHEFEARLDLQRLIPVVVQKEGHGPKKGMASTRIPADDRLNQQLVTRVSKVH